jgi:hypothetical protein
VRCLATAGKHVQNIWAIARQPPIIIEGLMKDVLSVGSAQGLYNEDPGRLRGIERVS